MRLNGASQHVNTAYKHAKTPCKRCNTAFIRCTAGCIRPNPPLSALWAGEKRSVLPLLRPALTKCSTREMSAYQGIGCRAPLHLSMSRRALLTRMNYFDVAR